MSNIGFAAVAALLAAAPALAQADAPAASGGLAAFNGPFVGVQAGWQQDRTHLTTLDSLGDVASGGKTGSAVGFGGQVGADIRLLPALVIGGEVAVTGRSAGDDFADGAGNAYRLRPGRTIDITGRAGLIVPGAGGLAYLRGGYANARFDLADAVARTAFDRDGYTVGGGYEQPLSRHLSARLDYAYSDFGRTSNDGTAADLGLIAADTRLHRNAVTAGLNFRF